MHSEKVIRDMALLPQGEGQETININLLGRQHKGKGPQVGPSHYYMKPIHPQVQIPETTSPTSHPAHTILPTHPSIPQHNQITPQSPSSSLQEDPSMVWDQPGLSSSTSEALYAQHPHGFGSLPGGIMPGARSLSNQMFTMTVGSVSPSSSSSLSQVSPYLGDDADEIQLYAGSFGLETMHGFPYNGVGESTFDVPSRGSASMTPEALSYTEATGWNGNIYDNMSNLRLGPKRGLSRKSSNSSLPNMESRSNRSLSEIPIEAGYQMGYSYDIGETGESPNSDGQDEEVPPYAELIYEALKSAPGHQMHLQDIYNWFRANYAKFRNDTSKGWMNSIRHNLSMNGAFIKVERPANEPGKGYMWLLAPAALQGGIKSTTRYRKSGPAKNRPGLIENADKSYHDYVTPKRLRAGKRIQTKARRTAKKNLQRMQQVDQQQPQDYTDSHGIHTPLMTPDYSPYPSDNFSETLSSSSRHATPSMPIHTPSEWQSPTPIAHHISSPGAYYSHSDDGFSTPHFDGPISYNYSFTKQIPDEDYE
ncbi:hypothetical protein ABW19_dt0208679 [Dactylella cylindrospora]|nr:hypothetical protein ABW19_dt0208679 [Dactylella cylindrospora]